MIHAEETVIANAFPEYDDTQETAQVYYESLPCPVEKLSLSVGGIRK